MISIAKEIAKIQDKLFDFRDSRIESEFRKQVHLASGKNWTMYTQRTHRIVEYKPDEEKLRTALKDLSENVMVMAALDVLKREGSIRFAH